MKNLIIFFRTSPLGRGELILRLIGITFLSVIFIWGGIYLMIIDPRDIGSFSFMAVGILLLGAGIWGINPEAAEKWWHRGEESPKNDVE